MNKLSAREPAVLDAIALEVPEIAGAIASQQLHARVMTRKNTGLGFYTTFDVPSGTLIEGVSWPVGNVTAEISGLENGMAFLFGSRMETWVLWKAMPFMRTHPASILKLCNLK